jgi:hypothetical protein
VQALQQHSEREWLISFLQRGVSGTDDGLDCNGRLSLLMVLIIALRIALSASLGGTGREDQLEARDVK